jgi:lipoate-protein ligase A
MTLLLLPDRTLQSAEENLALDEALLLESSTAASRDEDLGFLRFWESPSIFVVLGVSCRIDDDVNRERCDADGIPILRRVSGGGTVLQGPGCLNFTLVLPLASNPDLRDVHTSYSTIVERCGAALHLDDVSMRGSCDLAIGDLKFSGNAQKRTRGAMLHQGTILHDFDLELIARYLAEPPKQPDYREKREHVSFVTNVPLTRDEVRSRITTAWETTPVNDDWTAPTLTALIDEKYSRREWTERF